MESPGEKYSYSFISLNRGLVLTVTFLGVLIFLSWIFNSDSYYSMDGLFIAACIWSLFFISHIFWDFKIKPNHKKFFLSDSELIFTKEGREIRLTPDNITSIEEFPSRNNREDKDFLENIMSSGYRITYPEGKFLIFLKVRNSRKMKKHLVAISWRCGIKK
ncbi:hypothetical protein [Cellvibrio polysaccharolyticus]|nr:hypothetical protein [Cellvibrio polysaccharolyticus]